MLRILKRVKVWVEDGFCFMGLGRFGDLKSWEFSQHILVFGYLTTASLHKEFHFKAMKKFHDNRCHLLDH